MKKIFLTIAIVVAGFATQAQISYQGEDNTVNPPLLNKTDSLNIEKEVKEKSSTQNPEVKKQTPSSENTTPQIPVNSSGRKEGESGKSGMFIINDINTEN